MSQSVETPTKTFQAGAALAINLRVKLSSAKLALAGAAEADIGTMEKPAFADGDMTAVRLRTAQGTVKMVASAAISAEAVVYGAASGKIASSANGNPVGIALEAAGANNDVIEVLRVDALEEGSGDDAPFVFGSGADAEMLWSTGDADNHALVLAVGDSSQSFHITDVGGKATDWNVSADTHPTVYIHSNTTPATDYLKIGAHDGSGSWGADMVGGAALYFGFDGLEALELAEVASAVNHVRIANAATGNSPTITNQGEADTGLIIAGFDGTNTEEILILDANAGAINEFTMDNAATGVAPVLSATGDDSDIDLVVQSKAGGWVQQRSSGTDGTTGRNSFPMTKTTQITTAGNVTYTAAQFQSGIIDRDPAGSARTDTTPTAALLVGMVDNPHVGQSFFVLITNNGSSTEDITVAAGSGVTLDGAITIADGKCGLFLVTFTNVTGSSEAVSIYGCSDNA